MEECLYFNYLQQKSLLENSVQKIKSLEAKQKKLEQEFSNMRKSSDKQLKNLEQTLRKNNLALVNQQNKARSEFEKQLQGKAFWYTISYIPRKIKNGFKCLKEHGLVYTLGRISHKFGRFKV